MDASKLGGDSLWADGGEEDTLIQLDEDEFNMLFVERFGTI